MANTNISDSQIDNLVSLFSGETIICEAFDCPQAKAMLAVITAKAPMAIRYSKVAINRGMDVDLRAGLELEKDLAAITFGTEDKQEGMDAFLAKRPAEFHNK